MVFPYNAVNWVNQGVLISFFPPGDRIPADTSSVIAKLRRFSLKRHCGGIERVGGFRLEFLGLGVLVRVLDDPSKPSRGGYPWTTSLEVTTTLCFRKYARRAALIRAKRPLLAFWLPGLAGCGLQRAFVNRVAGRGRAASGTSVTDPSRWLNLEHASA